MIESPSLDEPEVSRSPEGRFFKLVSLETLVVEPATSVVVPDNIVPNPVLFAKFVGAGGTVESLLDCDTDVVPEWSGIRCSWTESIYLGNLRT